MSALDYQVMSLCGGSVMLAQVSKISNMPAVGTYHVVLLKSVGTASAFGANDADQCNVPASPDGVMYTQAAAGRFHTCLLYTSPSPRD